MKLIHWFSPLPPDRTDIGHFTSRILSELSQRANLIVWTNTEDPSEALRQFADLRLMPKGGVAPAELNAADAVFYNLGNHGPFHAAILEQSWRVPGIVILHEADLHGLLAYTWVKRLNRGERYIEEMAQIHGEAGRKAAVARLAGEDASSILASLPLLSSALKNCLGVVCHSEMARCSATSMGVPALRTELPFATSSAPRQTVRSGPLRIVQFGYLNPYRRTLEILELLAKWPHRQAVRFDIYGQLWDEALVQKRIQDLDLAGLVTIHGFAEESDLNNALAAADLALNLRYPTIGEASGSQMRIWSVSVPSVVPAIGWFAELPDDGVVKISIAHETEELITIFEVMLRDRYCFDDIGHRGRQILEKRHSPASYADTLMHAVNDLPALRRRAGSLMAIEAASRRVWGSGSVLPSPALGLGALGDLCDLFVPRGTAQETPERAGGPKTSPVNNC